MMVSKGERRLIGWGLGFIGGLIVGGAPESNAKVIGMVLALVGAIFLSKGEK